MQTVNDKTHTLVVWSCYGDAYFPLGVKFLHPNTLVTTSVDQRINTWQSIGSSSEKSRRLASSHFHDVADTAALQLFHTQ